MMRHASDTTLVMGWAPLAFLAALCACSPAPAPGANEALGDTLKAMIADAYDFSRSGVVERMMGLYSAQEPVISATGGTVAAGRDSIFAGIDAFWQNVGRNMRDAKWVWGDVYVRSVGPDAAVLTGSWSIPHTAPHGGPHVVSGAWTAVFHREGRAWKIVHEHLSAPPQPSAAAQPAASTDTTRT